MSVEFVDCSTYLLYNQKLHRRKIVLSLKKTSYLEIYCTTILFSNGGGWIFAMIALSFFFPAIFP